ncbi:hypothetical protein LTR66_000497 [Elasticomyces elasticus]|nr:hypothetical protein LTR28_004547 [Elasticomyces elasticus]KAK5000706.1 hypothetical protein LTR66_000497 [Elasticomyces elasticus]
MDMQSYFGVSTPSPLLSSSSTSVTTPDTDYSDDRISVNTVVEDASYIFVIGGLGYIGSHTVLALVNEGYNVVVVDDLSNSFSTVFDRIKLLAAEYCRANCRDLPLLRFYHLDYRSSSMRALLWHYRARTISDLTTLAGCRSMVAGVIHFAALKSVSESLEKPLAYYQNNVGGLVDFLSTLQEFGIKRFVFSSSATVYGSLANHGVPLREQHCVHQTETYLDALGRERVAESGVRGLTSPYGRTKWMCEAILADVATADPSWQIAALRYFNPVGCHESGLLGEDPRQIPTNLFPVIIRVLAGAQPACNGAETVLDGADPVLNIFGTDWGTSDGTAVRDFIHVADLARGHVAALAALIRGTIEQPFRTFNLGTGQGHTVREVVDSMEKASLRQIPVRNAERRKGDVGSCVAEVQRARQELGWSAEKTLGECASTAWAFVINSEKAQPLD